MDKIKSFKEYINLASNTLVELPLEEHLLHMNLGFKTEKGEFLDVFKKHLAYGKEIDWVNVGEELADYCWYIAGVFHAIGIKDEILDNLEEELAKSKGRYDESTDAKRSSPVIIAYNFAEKFKGDINDVIHISVYCEYADLDFWQILTNNIEKLKVRFPEKFNQDKALNRDLDSERKKLEK